MENYKVYVHTNLINGKKYIGMTKQEPVSNRWGANGANYKESPHFYAAIQKYGWENFSHKVLFRGLTKEQACQKEKELINYYHTQDNRFGYNILEGGQHPVITDEVRKKISKGLQGNKNGYGKPCSEEKKEKIRKAQQGRLLTEEHKQKLKKPKSVSYPCSEEKRQKIIQAKKDKKPIVCEETGIEYESVQECARQLNLYATNVSKAARGKIKTTGGYHFRFKNNA